VRPKFETHSENEIASAIDGSFFKKFDGMQVYGCVKYIATIWIKTHFQLL
jgi:hypothetical protein